MDDSMQPDSVDINSDVEVEVSAPEEMVLPKKKLAVSSIQRSEAPEDIDDARSQSRYRRGYPVGYAPEILGEGKTKFKIWQEEQRLHGENEWAPFHNQKEWDLAQWLIRNVRQKSTDEFLKLPIVSMRMDVQSRLTNLQGVLDSRERRIIIR